MSDYTPTTPVIRGAYIQLHSDASWESKQPRLDEFNRWLDEVRAEAWDEGFNTGVEDSFDFIESENHECIPNPYRQEPGDQDADLNPSNSMGIEHEDNNND